MDRIHDLGGMHGFSPVRVERNEPVFHARWEGRVYALTGATGGSFAPNIDKFRHAIERIAGRVPERWLLRALAARDRDAAGRSRRACARRGRSVGTASRQDRVKAATARRANLRRAKRSRRRPRPEQPSQAPQRRRPPALEVPP